MRLQPKNWAVFQHYKDRSPPWIKPHRDLLINRDFICLPLASKALAPLLWLLASESKDGTFDASFEELQFRLRISEKEYQDGLRPLIDKGFFFVASGALADRKQAAIPETEGEGETETEKDAKASKSGSSFPPCPHQEILKLWAKHLPHLPQPRVWEGSRQAAMRSRWVQAGRPSSFSENGYKTVSEGLDWWDSFFAYIATDTKLADGFESNGRVWRPDLEWVVNASNFAKIIDGKYSK